MSAMKVTLKQHQNFLVFSNNAVWYIRKYCDLNKYLVMRSTCVREGSEVTLLSSTTGDNNCTLSGVTKWSNILQKKKFAVTNCLPEIPIFIWVHYM